MKVFFLILFSFLAVLACGQNTHVLPKNQYSTHYALTAVGANPAFIVHASGVLSVTSNYVYGNPIIWSVLTTGGHEPSWYIAAYQSPSVSNEVRVIWPNAKTVLNTYAVIHRSADQHGVWVGPTVALNFGDFSATVPVVGGYSYHGDGAGNWVNEGLLTGGSLSTFSTADGGTSFNIIQPDAITYDYNSIGVIYQGPNQYTVQRVYSGLGSYNAKFQLVTPAGGYLSTNPTSNDHIIFPGALVNYVALNLGTYDLYNNWLIASGSAIFWLAGDFECWEIASPASNTSVQVKWQDYNGDSVYIYRATDTTFSSATLVYSAAAGGGSFIDASLTPNTVYYYGFYPSVSGVKTKITWFPTVTNY